MNLKKIYWKFLPFIKFVTPLIPDNIRYGGKDYNETLKMIKKTEYLSDKEKYTFQVEKLRNLLIYSKVNVPYWSNLFKKIDFNPVNFTELYHIEKLPLLTKDIIKGNFEDMISKSANKYNSHIEYTGGTTGQPNKFLVNNSSRAKEWAFMHSQWFRKGYKINEKKLVLRGHQSNNNSIKKNPWYNEYIISPYDDIILQDIVKVIKKEKITVIHGYPSRIYDFSQKCLEKQIKIPEISLILFGSEALMKFQKEIIKKVFINSDFYSWYGQSEQVILGGYCEQSQEYHSFFQYGLLEVLKDDGKTSFIGDGELIGTGFLNYFMPLIRYRTGDKGKVLEKKCACGRNYSLFEINEGRIGEFVIDKNGKKIPLTSFIFGTHSEELSKLGNFLLYQDKIGELEVRYESNKRIDEKKIIEEFEKISLSKLRIVMKKTKNVSSLKNGKHNYIIQKVDD